MSFFGAEHTPGDIREAASRANVAFTKGSTAKLSEDDVKVVINAALEYANALQQAYVAMHEMLLGEDN